MSFHTPACLTLDHGKVSDEIMRYLGRPTDRTVRKKKNLTLHTEMLWNTSGESSCFLIISDAYGDHLFPWKAGTLLADEKPTMEKEGRLIVWAGHSSNTTCNSLTMSPPLLNHVQTFNKRFRIQSLSPRPLWNKHCISCPHRVLYCPRASFKFCGTAATRGGSYQQSAACFKYISMKLLPGLLLKHSVKKKRSLDTFSIFFFLETPETF